MYVHSHMLFSFSRLSTNKLTSVWLLFRLDALALSVIATARWLAGWVAGCHTPVLYHKKLSWCWQQARRV